MSYLGTPYQHDVFVSYSHGAVGFPRLQDYSQRLAEDLRQELGSFHQLSRTLRLYLDQSRDPEQNLDPMRHLRPQLEEAARHSGIFVVLMSDHYLTSPVWCPEERRWWLEQQRQQNLSMDGRLAVVSIWKLAAGTRWPADLCDPDGEPLPGISFVDAAAATPQPHGWPVPEESASVRDYRKQVMVLANRIAENLERFRKRLEVDRDREKHAAKLGEDPLVYLHARSESPDWARARSELAANGIKAVPGSPAYAESSASQYQKQRQLRIETMAGSDALFLLGDADPMAIEADLTLIGRLDRHAAISHSNRPLPCALLDIRGVAANYPKLVEVADYIGVRWLDAANAEWPAQARQWLRQAGGAVAP